MTFDVLIVLVLLALLLARWRRRRGSNVLAVLAVLLFVGVGCGPLPVALLTQLQAPYAMRAPVSWGQRNAIVLLGGGTVRVPGTPAIEARLFAYGRISQAAALYHDCRRDAQRSCKVEVSGGDVANRGRSEADVYGQDLRELGVDPADILLETRSMNTWQNAQFSVPLLKAYAPDRVLLVSSGFHLRRGVLYFTHFGIDATPVRADYLSGVRSWEPLAYNFTMSDIALHEYAGILRYRVYNMLGWNVAATRPGAL